jgi:hypothetical protein
MLSGPQFDVQGAPHAHDDRRCRLDVARAGVEVHDAGAQDVATVDDGIRDEQLAAALQAIEQLASEGVQVGLDRAFADA